MVKDYKLLESIKVLVQHLLDIIQLAWQSLEYFELKTYIGSNEKKKSRNNKITKENYKRTLLDIARKVWLQ